ncbi:two-component system, response regulator YesN [Paenibacillus catalpae]|uniref:Two-component system, response regulator YesN n=1 Tax=Paenibacillus catalpae TaxID=1045775 RepID=A0A1I1TWV1_9BACL|nr:helix-turn-helix domain-containing protein [Paenibacillus catalpae]SFD63042.1 two-component system, response regulator YesN [Paenibacillus catalpae]
MLRLLIVDNEEIIVNHLFEVFRGMDHLSLDVYKAYSGEEAIEWLHRTRMDIVLTDIDMPNINGLQLMDEIFKQWPQCKIIFLTGHSEFSYIYKAIQHPDVSYILKLEDIEKVIQAVEETVFKIRKEIKTGDLIREAKEKIHIALELFQEGYLLNLLKGSSMVKATKEQFDQLSLPITDEAPVILVVGKLDDLSLQDNNYLEKIQQIYSVRQMIKRYLTSNLKCVIILDDHFRFTILIQPKENVSPATEDYVHTLHYIKGMLESVQQSCQDKLNHSISFAVGSKPATWNDISQQYHALHSLLNYRIGTENTVLLVDNEVPSTVEAENKAECSSDEEFEAEQKLLSLTTTNLFTFIEQYLESGLKDKYFEELEQVLQPLSLIKNKNNLVAQQVYCSISMCLLSYMNRWGLRDKVISKIGEIRFVNTVNFCSWGDAVTYIRKLSVCVFELQKLEQKRRADNVISFIQNFIISHLGEDLSLVRLSEQVYLNPSYLSRIFKQETKKNLTEFIDAARIQRAKELLVNENIKIHEIARQVGYESATSFTRFFKSSTGCSPQEYRDSYVMRVK